MPNSDKGALGQWCALHQNAFKYFDHVSAPPTQPSSRACASAIRLQSLCFSIVLPVWYITSSLSCCRSCYVTYLEDSHKSVNQKGRLHWPKTCTARGISRCLVGKLVQPQCQYCSQVAADRVNAAKASIDSLTAKLASATQTHSDMTGDAGVLDAEYHQTSQVRKGRGSGKASLAVDACCGHKICGGIFGGCCARNKDRLAVQSFSILSVVPTRFKMIDPYGNRIRKHRASYDSGICPTRCSTMPAPCLSHFPSQALRTAKADYRAAFDGLRDARSALDIAADAQAAARQSLLAEFEAWLATPAGTIALTSPPTANRAGGGGSGADELDAGEAFERMALQAASLQDPDSVAYTAALRKVGAGAGGGGSHRDASRVFGGTKALAGATRKKEHLAAINAGTLRA
jgi:hypothetical protein